MALPKKKISKSRQKVVLPKPLNNHVRVRSATMHISRLKVDYMGNYDRGIFFSIKKKYLRFEKEEASYLVKKKSKCSVTLGVLKPKALTVGILAKSRKSLPKPPIFLKKTPTNIRVFRKENSKRSKYIKRLVTFCKLRTLAFYYPTRTPSLTGLWRRKIKKFGVGTVIRKPLSKFRLKLKPFSERPRRESQKKTRESPILLYTRYTSAQC